MTRRSALHQIRDVAVSAAAYRPFRPIESPEKRIVLVRPDHFGDMLMLSPALRLLRERVTDHEIVLMTGPWNEAIARHIAPVDRIVTWEFPGFARDAEMDGLAAPYIELRKAASAVRDMRPEAIVLLRDDHWWGAWMGREAGVPLRVGYAHPQGERFLTHPLDVASRHYVEQNFEILSRTLAVLGYPNPEGAEEFQGLRLTWPEHATAAAEARDLIANHGISNDYLVIHPGTGAAVKRWPAERWSVVADRLNQDPGLDVVLTGSPDDRDLCRAISVYCQRRPVDLSGETSLFSLAELFRGARAVLGVDSGPLHLATAVATPSLHLYGPSDSVRYGPWGDPARHRVLSAGMTCPACGNLAPERPEGCGCMLAITVDRVVLSAREVIGNAV